MTCNFVNHERELLDAFEEVCTSSGENWTIFDYELNSNILKPESSGNGGLEELLESFQGNRIQYGFVSVLSADGKQQKVVLVHWQGEAVPAIRLANTASHIEEVRRFFKRVNYTIYARNQEDLNLDEVKQKLQKLSTMAPPIQQKPTPFIPPTSVGSVYEPVKKDFELSERESFWKAVQEEEEQRRHEEAKRREEQQKQFQLERKLLEKELHEAHLSAAIQRARKEAESQPKPATKPKPPVAAPTLVGGRTKMFNRRIEEISMSTTSPNKPKQYKFEVPIQAKNNSIPVNAGTNYANDDFVPIVEDPSKPIAKVTPQQPPEVNQEREELKEPIKKENPYKELKAITLWDYQAEDTSEISFDSDEIIVEIKKTADDWWTGRIGDKVGLFPANYVKLL